MTNPVGVDGIENGIVVTIKLLNLMGYNFPYYNLYDAHPFLFLPYRRLHKHNYLFL